MPPWPMQGHPLAPVPDLACIGRSRHGSKSVMQMPPRPQPMQYRPPIVTQMTSPPQMMPEYPVHEYGPPMLEYGPPMEYGRPMQSYGPPIESFQPYDAMPGGGEYYADGGYGGPREYYGDRFGVQRGPYYGNGQYFGTDSGMRVNLKTPPPSLLPQTIPR